MPIGYFSSIKKRLALPFIAHCCIGFKTVTHKLVSPKGDLTLNVRLYPLGVDLRELEVVGFRNNVNGMQTFAN